MDGWQWMIRWQYTNTTQEYQFPRLSTFFRLQHPRTPHFATCENVVTAADVCPHTSLHTQQGAYKVVMAFPFPQPQMGITDVCEVHVCGPTVFMHMSTMTESTFTSHQHCSKTWSTPVIINWRSAARIWPTKPFNLGHD